MRVAGHGGAIYLDLGDGTWDMVRVTGEGWEIVASRDAPVRFRRPRALLPLPKPMPGGDVGALLGLLNVKDDQDWMMLVAWLLSTLRPSGPYPAIQLVGEPGAAKTTTGNVLRGLVDPNSAKLRSAPRGERDLWIAANNGWVIAFDNLSFLPGWLSDALCRLATGGGFATRELYADDDEVIFDGQRAVILTGIEDVSTRGDPIDRLLLVKLESIPEDARMTEKALWATFGQAAPGILGGLLDVVSAGLRRLPEVRLDHLPRMADFALWIEACGPALGWEPGEFLAAYEANRAAGVAQILEELPILEPLKRLVPVGKTWQGTATDLLELLEAGAVQIEMAKQSGVNDINRAIREEKALEKVKRREGWPKQPNALTGTLRRAKANLAAVGILLTEDRVGKDRTRTLIIERVEEVRKTSSASSASSATGGKQADDPLHGAKGGSSASSATPSANEGQADGPSSAEHIHRPPSSANGHGPASGGDHAADDADGADDEMHNSCNGVKYQHTGALAGEVAF